MGIKLPETEEKKERKIKIKIAIPPEPARKIKPREEKEGKPIAEKGKKERKRV